MKKLSEKAMLVNFKMSVWTGRTKDAKDLRAKLLKGYKL